MMITHKHLRRIINEELLHEFFGIGEKINDYTKKSLSSYFRDNADDIASSVVPGIPFDADLLEGYFERSLADSIRENSDLLADCILTFFNPLAAVKSAKDDTASA